jgi:hypothetical protein
MHANTKLDEAKHRHISIGACMDACCLLLFLKLVWPSMYIELYRTYVYILMYLLSQPFGGVAQRLDIPTREQSWSRRVVSSPRRMDACFDANDIRCRTCDIPCMRCPLMTRQVATFVCETPLAVDTRVQCTRYIRPFLYVLFRCSVSVRRSIPSVAHTCRFPLVSHGCHEWRWT